MQLEGVIAKVFGVPLIEVSDDTSNKNLSSWDSFGHLTLILELEATYGVSFSTEEVFGMTSVASIKQVLSSHAVTW